MTPEIIVMAAIVAAFWVGRWAGRVGAETQHREEMATRLADDIEEARVKSHPSRARKA